MAAMSLRDLPDLDLAALVSALHEGMLGALALQGVEAPMHGSPWAMVTVLHGAANSAGREMFARRACEAPESRLFPDVVLPLSQFKKLRGLLKHLAAGLTAKGFPQAAQLLEERLAELCADVAGVQPGIEALEFRSLH